MNDDHGRFAAWVLPLTLALFTPTLAQAQDDRPQERVEGRNARLARAFQKVTNRVRPHVVRIQLRRGHLGYGVMTQGGVLTANGILPRSRSSDLRVVDHRGVAHKVEIQGRNTQNDIALLKVVSKRAPEPIPLGSSKNLRIGQFVVVVGTDSTPLAAGVVSAKNRGVARSPRRQQNVLMSLFSADGNEGHQRNYPRVVQHDAPLRPDHFGAPLIDAKGRLVGINVAAPFRGSSHAVGIDQIRKVLEGLREGRRPITDDKPPPKRIDPRPERVGPRPKPLEPPQPRTKSPWLGASVAPAPADLLPQDYSFGLEVTKVAGPAVKAGLQSGDLIVAFDGQSFADMDEFASKLLANKPGDTIKLTVIRGKAGIRHVVPVVLGGR